LRLISGSLTQRKIMLYRNAVLFNEKSASKEEWDAYLAKLKQIQTTFPKICKFKERRGINIQRDSKGLPVSPPLFTIPAKSTINGPTGAEEWIYSPIPCTIKDGKVSIPTPYNYLGTNGLGIQEGELSYDRIADTEAIYYIVEKESMYKKGRYILEDKKAMAKKGTSEMQLKAQANFLIFHDNSPLSRSVDGNEHKMRTLASAYGIENAHDSDEMSFDEVQLALYEKVLKINNIDKFIFDSGMGHETVKRAMIQKACDKEAVFFSYADNKVKWTASHEVICEVPPQQVHNWFNYFCQYAIGNDKLMQYIEGEAIDQKKYDPKQMDIMGYQEMQRLGNERGIKVIGIGKEDLRAELKKIVC
jgi:hypothetical protein